MAPYKKINLQKKLCLGGKYVNVCMFQNSKRKAKLYEANPSVGQPNSYEANLQLRRLCGMAKKKTRERGTKGERERGSREGARKGNAIGRSFLRSPHSEYENYQNRTRTF